MATKKKIEVEEIIETEEVEETPEVTGEFDSIRIRRKNWQLVLAIVLSLLVLIGGFITWTILSVDRMLMHWGPEDITFYSQMSFEDYGDDEFFKSGKIDSGLNEAVYDGTHAYSKFKNKKLNQRSQIGITESIQFSSDSSAYLNPYWGIDAMYQAGAKTVVTCGYNLAEAFDVLHTDYVGFSDADFIANGWKSVVIDDYLLPLKYESATSVLYNSAEAGFIAGLAASLYTTHNMIETYETGVVPNDDIVIWGGDSTFSVYSWMSGFEQGVNYFNYIVFGIDLHNGLQGPKASTEEEAGTLGLLTSITDEVLIADVDFMDGLDLTNGYELTPDYSGSVAASNDDFTNLEIGNETWYNGGFEISPIHDSASIAQDRTNNAIQNGVSAIFPVAGAQTTIASRLIREASEINPEVDVHTKVIGIDVDGTEADAEHADAYLGSATKNITDATSLAVWYSDDTINHDKKDPEFGGITGSDFSSIHSKENPNGWKVDELHVPGVSEEPIKVKGNLFIGDFENNGLGFVDAVAEDETSLLDTSFNTLSNYINDQGQSVPENVNSFMEFVTFAYNQNVKYVHTVVSNTEEFAIESFSHTFVPADKDGLYLTHPACVPWIPDWNTYKHAL